MRRKAILACGYTGATHQKLRFMPPFRTACSTSHAMQPTVLPALVLASTTPYRAAQKIARSCASYSHGRMYSP